MQGVNPPALAFVQKNERAKGTLRFSSMCMNARRSFISLPVDLARKHNEYHLGQPCSLPTLINEIHDETYLYSSGNSFPPAPNLAFFDNGAESTTWSVSLLFPFMADGCSVIGETLEVIVVVICCRTVMVLK